jgi:hypothetical protein
VVDVPCGISVTKAWSLNKTCSDRSGKTITSPLHSLTRRSGATRSPAAYSQGVALLSKAVAPTQRLSCSSSTVFFSRESVFVASARTYLIHGQRWRYSRERMLHYWCLRSIKDIKVLRVLRRNAASCAKAVKARSGDEGPEGADKILFA